MTGMGRKRSLAANDRNGWKAVIGLTLNQLRLLLLTLGQKGRGRPMIPRRVAEHAKAQNWFAVALDFFIVVIGVFIGIEVANWNQARQDRQEERRYYGQLLVDLRSDLETFSFAERRADEFDEDAQL